MYVFSRCDLFYCSTVIAVLGENKWIPMSSKRVSSISVSPGGRKVDMTFEKSPVYDMVTIAYILNGHLYGNDCTIFAGWKISCTIYEDDSVDSIIG